MFDNSISPLLSLLIGVDYIFTTDDLRNIIELWKQKGQSGLIGFSSGSKDYLLIFCEGKFHCVYKLEQNTITKFSHDEFEASNLVRSAENLRSSVLPPLGLLITKMILDEVVPQPEYISSKNLSSLILMLEKGANPVLLEISLEKYYACVVIPGGGLQIRDVMFYDGSQIYEESDALRKVNSCFERGCVVRYYQYSETDSWLEYVLRYIFTLMTEQILNRASELTSRVMVNTIVRDINLHSASENIDIMLIDLKVQNKVIFKSPAEAVQCYSFILDLIIRHIERVTGSGLTYIVVRQIAAGLSDLDIDILKRFHLIQEVFLGFDINPKRIN